MTARDPLLSQSISEDLAAAMPGALICVVDVPPVVGAALLGLDHVGAAPAAAARLRECAATTWPVPDPARLRYPWLGRDTGWLQRTSRHDAEPPSE